MSKIKDYPISPLIQYQLPSFILSEGKGFLQFINAYYEWMQLVQLKVPNSLISPSFDIGRIIYGNTSKASGIIRGRDETNGDILYVEMTSNTSFIDGESFNPDYTYFTVRDVTDDNFQVGLTVYGVYSKTSANVISWDVNTHTLLVGIDSNSEGEQFLNGESIYQLDEDSSWVAGSIINSEPVHNNIISVSYNPYAGIEKIQEFRDMDYTIDKFVSFIKAEYAKSIPDTMLADKKKVYKHIKQFYHAKGSIKAFKNLFNVLYNISCDVEYPDDKIFKPSDNKWNSYTVLRVQNKLTDETDFNDKNIIGEQSGATCMVEYEVSHKIGTIFIKDLYINRNTIVGEFIPSEYIRTQTGELYRAKFFGVISSYIIANGGSEYEVGDKVNLTPHSTGGSYADIEVSAVSSGRITSIKVNNGGSGYAVGESIIFDNTDKQVENFNQTAAAEISEVDSFGAIVRINMLSEGRGYVKLPGLTINTVSGTGASITPIGEDVGSILKLNIKEPGIGYIRNPTNVTITSTDGSGASILVLCGSSFGSSRFFRTNQGFLSDDIHIHDGTFYQYFSYVLRVNMAIDRWRNIIKSLAHPSGMMLYSKFNVDSFFNNELKKKYTYFSLGEGLYAIFFDNNDCNNPVVNFKNTLGDLYPTPHMDLNLNPYYKYETVYIYSIDLNEIAGPPNTLSSGYLPRPVGAA